MENKMKLLLYCTKGKPYLNDCKLINHNKRYFISNKGIWSFDLPTQQKYSFLNGKIVGECDYEVEEIESFIEDEEYIDWEYGYWKCGYKTYKEDFDDLMLHSYLTAKQLDNYLQGENGYAIHIKNLHIFDKPKELSEFYKIIEVDEADFNENDYKYVPIEKAPQNMMYCYLDDGGEYYDDENEAILISIHPEWLCKILNGEKTVEIRKKVLKGML